jgi:hypothetical protein
MIKPLIVALLVFPTVPQTPPQPKPIIKVMVRVDAQGPQIIGTQHGLSSAELNQLRTMIDANVRLLYNIEVVPDYRQAAAALLVAADKVTVGQESIVVLSSVVNISKADGTNIFVNHNVFAVPNLDTAAKAVIGPLAAAEVSGAIKQP